MQKKQTHKIVNRTNTIRLKWLEGIVGHNVYAKLENHQNSGSFKIRGIVEKIKNFPPDTTFVTASAGNHGLALAIASKEFNVKVNICVPTNASSIKKERILYENVGIIEHGSTVEEAIKRAIFLSNKNGWVYISPYNDEAIILGQSTAWIELIEDHPEIKTLICQIGGGGLISGAIHAKKFLERNDINIIGCEPENFASMRASIENGKITGVMRIPTFADGLATNIEDNSITFSIVENAIPTILTLNEEEIAAGVAALLIKESILSEGAGALGILSCLKLAEKQLLDGPVGLVISGGNISHSTLSKIINYPFSDKSIMKLLNLTGKKIESQPVYHLINTRKENVEKFSDGSFAMDLAFFFNNLREESINIQNKVNNLQSYCKTKSLIFPEDSILLINKNICDLQRFIERSISTLDNELPKTATILNEEINLRTAYKFLSSISGSLNWCSPSYNQSLFPQFFDLGSQDSGDVNYERYGIEDVKRIEAQLLDVFRLQPEKYACTVVSSGMAAYALVEAHLIRNVLNPEDTISKSPYIYFESDEQLSSLKFFKFHNHRDFDINSILKTIKSDSIKVTILDPCRRQEGIQSFWQLALQNIRQECCREIGKNECRVRSKVWY